MVIYLLMLFYFKSIGGYKPVTIEGEEVSGDGGDSGKNVDSGGDDDSEGAQKEV